ncbi:MAG: AI-2E family transporter [Planctomycetaceae bacterium]
MFSPDSGRERTAQQHNIDFDYDTLPDLRGQPPASKVASHLRRPGSQYAKLQQIASDVNSYMSIKTSTSLLTGAIVTVGLWWLNVEFALLMGLLAFLFNYVPNIGSILAAVPAVLLAALGNGLWTAALVVALYLVVNMLIGYFVEPRWMGRGLGLSTLVVFLSLVFWGGCWDPLACDLCTDHDGPRSPWRTARRHAGSQS